MREIIRRIKEIEKEETKRKYIPIKCYNKEQIHLKQMNFHRCLKRNRWVFGGNRSGKTECGAVETVWLARGIHPFRENKSGVSCWVVSPSQQVQRDVAQRKILYYLEKSWIKDIVMTSGSKQSPSYGVIDTIIIYNVKGGTGRIGFKSSEAGREKFQGTSLDFVWFDEEPPEDIYEECRMRVLDKCGHIFGTMTPLKGRSWVYDEIFLNTKNSPEVWCEFMEWADNPYLSAEETRAMSETMSKESLESRRYGRFRDVCGLVYPEFDPSVHVIEPFDVPKYWQDTLSIDPGLNNPLSCHWYATDGDGNVYVVAEHYERGRSVTYHAEKIKEISRKLGWKTDSSGNIRSLIDSAACQRTLSCVKTVAELFFENGINVNAKVNKDVFSGINRVKSYLGAAEGSPKLYIFSCCVEMIKEIKGYFWGNNDAPVKTNDHAMDELRYYICSRPRPSEEKLTKSRVEKDKEKLYKKLAARRNPYI